MTDAADHSYSPGERIPGTEYVVVRQERGGGHGALYTVQHYFLEKQLRMLKTLKSIRQSADLSRRMVQEAQVLAAMEHPHIVQVISAGLTAEEAPRPFFVMERLRGKSLQDVLASARGGLGVKTALRIAIEIADALDYVHGRHGVIHRDIKPDNIFLHATPPNDSITKLLDFGIAHVLSLDRRVTDRMILGTPRYMAPEQIRGERPTPHTDLYALGLVLFEMLTGKGPFDSCTTLDELYRAQLEATPSFARYDYTPKLEQIVLSMLAKSPAERPRSAEWVAIELRQIKLRIEEEYGRAFAVMNKTDETPMENILTTTRAEEVGSDGAATNPVNAGARIGAAGDKTDPGMELPPLDGKTLENAPDWLVSLRSGDLVPGADTLVPRGTPPIDRTAQTRSFPATPPPSSAARTDTMEVRPHQPALEPAVAVPVVVREAGARLVADVEEEEVDARVSTAPRPAAGAPAKPRGLTTSAAGVVTSQAVSRRPERGGSARSRRSFNLFAAAAAAVCVAAVGFVGARRGQGAQGASAASSHLPGEAALVAAARVDEPVHAEATQAAMSSAAAAAPLTAAPLALASASGGRVSTAGAVSSIGATAPFEPGRMRGSNAGRPRTGGPPAAADRSTRTDGSDMARSLEPVTPGPGF